MFEIIHPIAWFRIMLAILLLVEQNVRESTQTDQVKGEYQWFCVRVQARVAQAVDRCRRVARMEANIPLENHLLIASLYSHLSTLMVPES